jgi:hypothetical protein
LTEPQPSFAPEDPPSGGRRGRNWAIAGMISGAVAVVLLPVVFGPLGAALGIVAFVKGSRGPGVAAIVAGVLGLMLGVVLSAVLLSVVNQA